MFGITRKFAAKNVQYNLRFDNKKSGFDSA